MKLKSVFFKSLLVASAFCGLTTACADDHFSIEGVIKKEIRDQEIYLDFEKLDINTPEKRIKSKLVDGKFHFEGEIVNPPARAQIVFEDKKILYTGWIYAENSDIDLVLAELDSSKARTIKNKRGKTVLTVESVEGSGVHDKYKALTEDLWVRFDEEYEGLMGQVSALNIDFTKPMNSMDPESLKKFQELSKKMGPIGKDRSEYLKNKLNDPKTDDLTKLFILHDNRMAGGYGSVFESEEQQKSILDGLDQNLRDSQAAKSFAAYMDKNALKEKLAMEVEAGNKFKNFTQPDVNNEPVTVSELLSPGRYLLVDFWASWCIPCRAENPHILKEYKKYHSEYLDVLAVSLDDDKDEWVNAIEEDGMPWLHVSDLKGRDNDAALLYGVSGIPMNFLLNDKGEIVASNLRGDELHKALEKVIGK
ncbi:TlpA disulfide reductase family protein [Porticoccaceae bacterium LTM1]|nr:TlpA disulfide reductase family protein [Porticoccaceae bacterium LTM1]